MYDELTEVDLQKMREEIDYRTRVLRPQLIEEVQTTRAFGDLSENYEYKCAKQAKNRNDSRIRYLERMIRTAKVISVKDTADAVGLFDKVTIFHELTKAGDDHSNCYHAPPGRLEGFDQQGVPGGEGPAGPQGRRPGGDRSWQQVFCGDPWD